MAYVIREENETCDQLIKRFSRQFTADGTLKDLREKEFFKSKGQKRREKIKAAQRAAWVKKMKSQRYFKHD